MAKYKEEELQSKYINHIKLKLQASLLMLLNNLNEIYHEKPDFPEEPPEEFEELTAGILNQVKNLEASLSMPAEERSMEIEQISVYKTKVIEIGKSIEYYLLLNKLVSNILGKHFALHEIRNTQAVNIDYTLFYSDCMHFLEWSKENGNEAFAMSSLMKHIPLKMTKDKYYEYVEKGLHMLSEDAELHTFSDLLGMIKETYLPEPPAKKYFPILDDELNTYLSLPFESLTKEEIDEHLEHLEDNLETTGKIIYYLELIFEALNGLLLILSFAPGFDYLTEGNIVAHDLYHTVSENVSTDAFDIYKENFLELYESQTTPLIDKIIADEKEGFLDLNATDLEHYGADIQGLSKLAALTNKIYYELLQDQPDSACETAPESIAQIINSFMNYLKTAPKDLSPKLQRLLRQNILDFIPSCFTHNEFYTYMVYALENTLNYEEKFFCLNMTGHLFEDTGYSKEYDNTDMHDHHHTHDCGHDHHHGCDHHHHH